MIFKIYDFLSAEKPKFKDNFLGAIDGVISFKYTRRAYDIGSFEATVPAHDNNAALLTPDRMIAFETPDEDNMLMRQVLYITDVSTDDKVITVSGYDLKYLLSLRVTLFPQEEQDKGTYGYYVVKGTTYSCIKSIVDYNIVNAENDRRIFGFETVAMPREQIEAHLWGITGDSYMTRLEPVSTAIFNILKNCKTMFWEVAIRLYNDRDHDCYYPRLESIEDKPTLVISDDKYNIKSYTRKDGTSAYKNAIYAVAGASDITSTLVQCVKRDDSAVGIARKEVVVDIDVDNVDEVENYALKAAEEYTVSDEFEFEPAFDSGEPEPVLAQRVAVKIGDIVYETQITEITEEYSGDTKKITYVTGDKKAKVLNVINRSVAGNTQKVISNKIKTSTSIQQVIDSIDGAAYATKIKYTDNGFDLTYVDANKNEHIDHFSYVIENGYITGLYNSDTQKTLNIENLPADDAELATEQYVDTAVSGLASEQYVNDAVSAIDLTPYATKDELHDTIIPSETGKSLGTPQLPYDTVYASKLQLSDNGTGNYGELSTYVNRQGDRKTALVLGRGVVGGKSKGSIELHNEGNYYTSIESQDNNSTGAIDLVLPDKSGTLALEQDPMISEAVGNPIHIDGTKDGSIAITDWTKNLLYRINRQSQTVAGITITFNDDGSFVLNGTAASNGNINLIPSNSGWILDSGVYTLSTENNVKIGTALFKNGTAIAGISTIGTLTFDTSAYDYDAQNFVISLSSGDVFNNTVVHPMLVAGPVAHPYVPYSGYDITSCGKNLIPYPYSTKITPAANSGLFTVTRDNGIITVRQNNSGIAGSATWCYIIEQKPIEQLGLKSGDTVTFSKNSIGYFPENCSVYCMEDNGAGTRTQHVDTGSGITFTIRADTKKLDVLCGLWAQIDLGSDSFSFRPMLELGSAATAYEPYRSSTVHITNDTAVPVYGLKSFEGETNIFNNYNADMSVVYSTTDTGNAVLNSAANADSRIAALEAAVRGLGGTI